MKPIAIPRPDDPELAAQWDEAKRSIEARQERQRLRDRHTCIRDLSSRACHACNTGVPYPAMTLEDFAPSPNDDCCVGDVTRCRCAAGAKQLAMSDEDVDREKWMAVWSDESEAM